MSEGRRRGRTKKKEKKGEGGEGKKLNGKVSEEIRSWDISKKKTREEERRLEDKGKKKIRKMKQGERGRRRADDKRYGWR